MPRKLLDKFRLLFDGDKYRHRVSNLGDTFAAWLYEDLYEYTVASGDAPKYRQGVSSGALVYNRGNRIVGGKKVRRGDGLLGQAVPDQPTTVEEGYVVRRGQVANIRIGIETKIISTAMSGQFDRVMCDVWRQSATFRDVTPESVTFVVIGVNHADEYRSYEGEKFKDARPIREAIATVARIDREVGDLKTIDEHLVLPFKATNVPPYPFEWVDWEKTHARYNAALVRTANRYQTRFG